MLMLLPAGICRADELVFMLTAPYYEVADGITLRDLRYFWQGKRNICPFEELAMSEYTLQFFTEKWEAPSDRARITLMEDDAILSYAWENDGCWGLIRFENMDPRWKAIAVDGVSPFSLSFDPKVYALSVDLPEGLMGNYDRSKLTTLTLTGTTAMVRNLAYHIETDGMLVPVENIAEVLSASDITHISNEVSFYNECPPGVPLRKEARFCSPPEYMEILEAVGADVIELTGNHIFDWGVEPFVDSLDLYEAADMGVYGGGRNKYDAQNILLLEHHGNKIAFIGCNAVGPDNIWATDDQPGAAPCDLEKMKDQIIKLKRDGWMPVVTFQHFEWVYYDVPPVQSHDFLWIAREAAPVIVSGSQAHIPQGMTFVGDTFIHYGLGNLLFDQMSDVEKTSFFDRHYFYDGRYLGNQLETITLENYSQPRFLDPLERQDFLNLIFDTCTWNEAFADNNG